MPKIPSFIIEAVAKLNFVSPNLQREALRLVVLILAQAILFVKRGC
jgi:hypothetical protein